MPVISRQLYNPSRQQLAQQVDVSLVLLLGKRQGDGLLREAAADCRSEAPGQATHKRPHRSSRGERCRRCLRRPDSAWLLTRRRQRREWRTGWDPRRRALVVRSMALTQFEINKMHAAFGWERRRAGTLSNRALVPLVF